MKKIVLVAGLLFVTGCVGDGTRECNEQNYHAGMKLANEAPSPELKQLGVDVAMNSVEVMKDIGMPKEPAGQYSPDLSAKARKKAVDTRERRSWFLDLAQGLAGQLPWGGPAMALISGLYAWYTKTKKALSDTKLQAVYAGVDKALADIKSTKDIGEKLFTDAVDTLRSVAGNHNVYPDIKADLQKMRGA